MRTLSRFYVLLLFILILPCTALGQTEADLTALITTAQKYLTNSTFTASATGNDEKTSLEDAIAVAKKADASTLAESYNTLETALHSYLLAAQPKTGTSFDLTFKVNNPTLTTNSGGWSVAPTVNYNEAEIYNQTFDLYQTLLDMPSGTYTLGVTGFYRNSLYYSGIESATNAGCYLYANDESSLLLTLYYDAKTKQFWNNTGNYANNMSDAQQVFDQGYYSGNEVSFTLGQGDEMRLGIRNTGTGSGNWTCFRNFTLLYWGNGGKTVKSARKYRIACPQVSSVGSIVPGSTVNSQTPLYYSTTAVTGAEGYWFFTEEGKGKYSIRNASTKQYITWDGERIEASKRYVTLSDTLVGDSSLWTLTLVDDQRFCIRNVKMPAQLFDTRVDSYMVGTYNNPGAAAGNQQYILYDTSGNIVTSLNEKSFRSGLTTLQFNGKTVPCNQTDDSYLFPIPLSLMNGGTFRANVQATYKNGWSGLTVDSVALADDGSMTFRDIQPGKEYNLQIHDAEDNVANATITFTGMPVVELTGSFGDAYSQGTICVDEPDSANAVLLNAKIKWRGATTEYRNKKQYAIKLLDASGAPVDTCFFGLRSDNNWILDGMSIDVARMRNRVVTDLWEDYSVKPYYYDKQPDLINGTRGRFVEVFLNNSYVGIYCMTEKMDRKQLQLKKYDETDGTIKGELWKSSDWSYAVFMGHNSNSNYYPKSSPVAFNNTSETWDAYEVKYPDLGDSQPINWSELYDAVNFVCTSSDADFTSQVASYFDMPVMLDYYILMETILSADNHGKNMYFYIYNRNKDKKISFGPWDLDSTCGRRWNSQTIAPGQDYTTYIINNEHGDYNLFKRIKACNVNNFNDSVRFRYRDLRRTKLNTDSILSLFRHYKDLFDQCGASAREIKRWNNTDAGTLDFEAEMQYLTDWFTTRMTFIDKQWDIANLPETPNDIASLSIQKDILCVGADRGAIIVTANRPCHISVVTLSGQTIYNNNIPAGITTIPRLPKGIYIVAGHKVVVR